MKGWGGQLPEYISCLAFHRGFFFLRKAQQLHRLNTQHISRLRSMQSIDPTESYFLVISY